MAPVVPALVAALVGLILVVRLVSRALAAAHLDGPARAARRRAVVSSVVTVLATLAYVFVAVWPEGTEVRIATLPALAAVVGVVLAGLFELTWPRPRGERRHASSITARRGTEARRLRVLFAAGLGLSGALLVIGSLTAGPTGRAVTRDWGGGAASMGPYPGPPYAAPMGLALAALVLATWWSLRRVEARPALGPELEEVDRAIRHGAEVRVLRLAAGGSLLTAVGLSLVMGFSLVRVATVRQLTAGEQAPAAPFDWTQNSGFLLLALAVVGLAAALHALLARSPSVPAPGPRGALASEART